MQNVKNREETVAHLTSEFSKLAQLEYKKRHDKVARIVLLSLCENYGLPRSKQWYRHTAEPLIEMDKVKILWDVSIQTDHVIEHRRPDIVVVENNKTALLIDIAVPGDTRVEEKEREKVNKTRIWHGNSRGFGK